MSTEASDLHDSDGCLILNAMHPQNRPIKLLVVAMLFALICAWSGTAVMRLSGDFCNKNLYAGRSLNTDDRVRIVFELPAPIASSVPVLTPPITHPYQAPEHLALRQVVISPASDISRSPPALSC